jgi:hypothetical protein
MSTSHNSSDQVRIEVSHYQLTRDRLLAQFPDLDDETLADTLEGITDLREMLAEVVRSALVDEALVAGLSTRLGDMKARLQRFEVRAKTKRSLVRQAMTSAELPKLSEPDFTASLHAGVAVLEVMAEDQIPEIYWKPQQPKLNRQGLLSALKDGAEIDGVELGPRAMQLSVRTK